LRKDPLDRVAHALRGAAADPVVPLDITERNALRGAAHVEGDTQQSFELLEAQPQPLRLSPNLDFHSAVSLFPICQLKVQGINLRPFVVPPNVFRSPPSPACPPTGARQRQCANGGDGASDAVLRDSRFPRMPRRLTVAHCPE
jgi:hypothetical protein